MRVALIFLIACGDNALHATLVRVDPEAAGAHCATGGVAVNSGADTNGDGVLEDSEITSTEYICDGSNGSNGSNGAPGTDQLVRVVAEPPGANCANGGSAVLVGLDTNHDGVLEDGEVTSTTYVCDGANTLIRVDTEPASTNCAYGGLAIHSGADTNGNGVLDDAEITATTYVCNVAPPPSVPVVIGSMQGHANDNFPLLIIKADRNSLVQIYTDSSCAGPVVATMIGNGFHRTLRLQSPVPDNSTTRFYATATTGSGTSDCSSTFATHFEDSTMPPNGGAVTCATLASGADSSAATAVAADSDGSLVVAGYYVGPETFGKGELGETTLTAPTGIFVARYRPDCSLVWARSIDGPADRQFYGNNDGMGLVLGGGSIYLAATFTGTATFDHTVLTAPDNDGFIAKLASDGSLVWVQQEHADPGSFVQTKGLAWSAFDDSLYVVGLLDGTATFGTTPVTYGGIVDFYLAHLASDGSLRWVRNVGAGGAANGNAVAATPDGGAVITGAFDKQITLGPGEPNQTALTSHENGSQTDVLIARYFPDGTLAWAKRAGDQGYHAGLGIAVSLDGTAATITGAISSVDAVGDINFGEGEPNAAWLGVHGLGEDMFIARYNLADGTVQWAKSGYLWDDGDEGRAVVATADGGATVVGTIGIGMLTFGQGTFGQGEPQETYLWANASDGFVAHYDSSGQLGWVREVTGPSDNEAGYAVAASPDGSITMAGRFGKTVIVDPALPYARILTATARTDAFIARFSPSN